MKKKFYDVEFKATTYRTYEVEASSQKEAEEIAFAQLDEDWEVSYAWKQDAEVSHVDELETELEKDSMELNKTI